jgi:hypothetical protein
MKKKGMVGLHNEDALATGDPTIWGPAVWAIFHILASHVGKQGMDADEARDFEIIINMIPQILPCEICQAHSRTYIQAHPFEAVKAAKVPGALGPFCETWLLTFHNAVRTQNEQPIEITTLEQLRALYLDKTIEKKQLSILVANVNYGIRTALIKRDVWQRWYILLNRLKVMSNA